MSGIKQVKSKVQSKVVKQIFHKHEWQRGENIRKCIHIEDATCWTWPKQKWVALHEEIVIWDCNCGARKKVKVKEMKE